jgi:hypothetical protein
LKKGKPRTAMQSIGPQTKYYNCIASKKVFFFLTQMGVKLSYLNNQITSDNDDVCATGWLGVVLYNLILVSIITSKYIT